LEPAFSVTSQSSAKDTTAPRSYPEGDWDFLLTLPADAEESYSVIAPTLGDSTAQGGIYWSTFFVRARTATPGVYFDSEPDSGYSVDNLEPSVPTGLLFEDWTVMWDECPDEDFDYFTVYGSQSEDFGEAELIGHTVETTFDVSESLFAWYFVTATDFAVNESGPASVESGISGIESETIVLPTTYALRSGSPNPFSGRTVLAFDLPTPGMTRLDVYDVRGRLVETLVRGELPAGRHRLLWTGRNARGEATSPGVYFVRLESGSFAATKKLLRVE
jgi:hypothetical protein